MIISVKQELKAFLISTFICIIHKRISMNEISDSPFFKSCKSFFNNWIMRYEFKDDPSFSFLIIEVGNCYFERNS